MKQQPRLLARLEETFHAVSGPDSPRYGQHLTLTETAALQAPSQQHVRQPCRSTPYNPPYPDHATRCPLPCALSSHPSLSDAVCLAPSVCLVVLLSWH